MERIEGESENRKSFEEFCWKGSKGGAVREDGSREEFEFFKIEEIMTCLMEIIQ